jgi:ABC-type dipeptide/oligopeptide/nickel transport system permease component
MPEEDCLVMGQYVLRRLIITIPLLLIVSFLAFSMTRFLPGDPARVIAGQDADEQVIKQIRHELGLDQPVLVQYRIYLSKILRGDFGNSIRTKSSVTSEIFSRFPATLELAISAMIIASIGGILLGVIAAVKRDGFVDRFALLLSISGMSIPHFWLGLILLVYLAGVLGWFPIGGRGNIMNLVLPAITLSARPLALITRLTRTNMIDVLNEGYIWTARSKGLKERIVVIRHALKNAILPTITVIGLQFGTLLAGVIVIETVFGWPGMGRLLISSIMSRDFPIVQAIILMMAFIFLMMNLLVDISYAFLDPRITYE